MKTVIIYGSKYGCTERCAKSLAQRLDGGAELINIKNNSNPDLSKYDKVIVGGSIYVGQIQKSIKEFCAKNLQELKKKKVGLFICCGFPENSNKHFEGAFPKELLDSAVARENFGGELNIDKMKFFDKIMTKMVTKAVAKEGKASNPPKILADNIDKLAAAING